jgi:hypothetical protein
MKNTQNKVEEILIDFAANAISTTTALEDLCITPENEKKFLILMRDFHIEWTKFNIDDEGTTPEQDKELDKILEWYSSEIVNLIEEQK